VYKISQIMLVLAVFLLVYSFAAVCLTGGWVGWIILAAVVAKLVRKPRKASTTLGSGRLATEEEMRSAGMIGGQGLILGWLPRKGFLDRLKAVLLKAPAKVICQQFFGHREIITLPPSTTHLSCYAPTGAGKNASLIIPWLQTVDESAVVIDFKGENALLSSQVRERLMGHRVVLLDPFRIVTPKLKRKPDSYNALDWIDKNSSRALDDCKALGNSLAVCPEGAERNEHFYHRARSRIAAVTGTTVYHGERDKGSRSLLKVASILSDSESLKVASQLMQQQPEIWGGALTRMGGQILSGASEELASVGGTVTTAIDFMNSPDVAENLKKSSFDPRDLYRKKMTIYCILPLEYMRSHAGLLRLWISSFVRVLIRGGLNKRAVNLIIDEAGCLGQMEAITDILNIGRGYSVKLQLYYQDMGQLERCWPRGASQGVLANTATISFGINDYHTAETLSKRLGMETIIVQSGGTNRGANQTHGQSSSSSSFGSSSGHNNGWQEQKREYATPDELMSLSPRIALTCIPGMRPVMSKLVRYYEEKTPFKQSSLGEDRIARMTLIRSLVILVVAVLVAFAATRVFQERMKNHGRQFGGQAVQHRGGKPQKRPF
jgi:type IV secretion system protein VirD4